MWAKSETSGRYFKINEGTGDNLLPEDVEEGYVDYIYYDIYENLDDVNQDNICDGGMYMLTKLYKDCSTDEILKFVGDFEEEKLTLIEEDC